MRPECVVEVAKAIGRNPTADEIQGIEADLVQHMRELARTEPKWREMSGEERLQAAAERATQAKLDEADKAAERRAANLLAQAREARRQTERAAEMAAMGKKRPYHAATFERLRQIDDYVSGIRNELLSDLIPALEKVTPRFLGLLDDPLKERAFVRAVMDGDKADVDMAKAAEVYTDKMEGIRLRSNAAGTDIGKLDYGYLPMRHDTGQIANAGKEKWVTTILPLLDRSRYVDASGVPMDDTRLLELLSSAWDTLATEGRSKLVPGKSRGGSRASRFDDAHRVLHFKDGDAYLAYHDQFGRGTMLEGILGHAGMMAKTIGMMEEFGANPNNTYRLLKDTAEKMDNVQGKMESFATLDMVWDTLNGKTAQPVNEKLARYFQGARNYMTAVKLQSVMLSSVTDAPNMVVVAKSNGMPMGDALKSTIAGFGGEAKRVAQDLAIGMDELSGEMSRWHTDHMAQGWTDKLANTTMRATLVEQWSNGLRRGFATYASRTLDRLRTTNWDALNEGDRRRFQSLGVTKDDWAVWQMAKSEGGMLTKNGIRAIDGIDDATKDRATARLLGYLDQEAKTAVFQPDLQTRAAIQQGTQAGTVGGEMLRSFMLFKSFSVGIVQKHLRRLSYIPSTAGKVAYSTSLLTSLTLFGALAVQLKDLANGKDPRDMTDPKFWVSAFLQGGGIGIFGDILYTGMGGNSRGGQANWLSMTGPLIGTGIDAFNVMRLGAGWLTADEVNSGKSAQDFGAEVTRLAGGNIPFIKLWYLKSAVDHMVLHDLQESLSPGYLSRLRSRSMRDYGQDWWWKPGEAEPERGPDWQAVGMQ